MSSFSINITSHLDHKYKGVSEWVLIKINLKPLVTPARMSDDVNCQSAAVPEYNLVEYTRVQRICFDSPTKIRCVFT